MNPWIEICLTWTENCACNLTMKMSKSIFRDECCACEYSPEISNTFWDQYILIQI